MGHGLSLTYLKPTKAIQIFGSAFFFMIQMRHGPDQKFESFFLALVSQ